VVRAFLLALLAAALCCGDTLDEAARNLARKLSARLTPGETPHVTARNLSTLGSHDFSKARASFERSFRHNRAAQQVEVVFTISQNSREYLLVAELRRPPERIVEIIPYRPEPLAQAAKVVLDRRLLWEQQDPILDLAVVDDRMLVLEPANLKLYTRRGSVWELEDSKPLNPATAVRDPRGRLQIADASLTAYLAGVTCRGSWIPTLDIHCEAADAEFPLSGESVKLIAGRNALASAGWPLFFSYGRIAEPPRPLFLLAEMDGRTHLYDAERRPAGVFDSWGSDFAVVETGCGAARDILATSSAERDANDTVADFEVVDRKAVESSDPLEFPGPITALWPAMDGAVAIAHNLNSGRYAAYSVSITCSH
jgi:hypothetical protein